MPAHECRSANRGRCKAFYRSDAQCESVLIHRGRHLAPDFTRTALQTDSWARWSQAMPDNRCRRVTWTCGQAQSPRSPPCRQRGMLCTRSYIEEKCHMRQNISIDRSRESERSVHGNQA